MSALPSGGISENTAIWLMQHLSYPAGWRGGGLWRRLKLKAVSSAGWHRQLIGGAARLVMWPWRQPAILMYCGYSCLGSN